MDKSFINKFLILLIIIILGAVIIFFFNNNKKVEDNISDLEIITNMNVDSFDEDLYIYKIENNIMYTSEYFFNAYYLSNNVATYKELKINEDTKYFLKTLSNSKEDINNVRISYDPINLDELLYLLDNYNLLKVSIWYNEDNTIKKVLLYSSNNTQLEIVHY